MGWLNRLANLWRGEQLNEDLDQELQFHLDARTRDNLDAGMPPDAARLDARRRFGNRTSALERSHDANVVGWLEHSVRDVLYALRSLRKSPGFTASAIVTLALGMGANTAVFTVVDGVLLRPLPFPHPEKLCLISYRPEDGPFSTGPGMADRHYLEYARHQRSFQQTATFGPLATTLTGAGEPVRIVALEVTSGFFQALGVNPAMGRTFLPEEMRAGNRSVVILGDRLWRSRFDADPNILGKMITLDGAAYRVIGVMPAEFRFSEEASLWRPLGLAEDHNSFFRAVVGRLAPGVRRPQAQAELEALARQLPVDVGERPSRMTADILPLKDLLTAPIRKSLLIFMGAVACVLLIACTNVANLLLMRGTARQQEIAVRAALGASRGRLIRQLLAESTVVSLAGSVSGIAAAFVGVRGLLALAPEGRIPRVADIRIDGTVLAFGLALGACTGILFGLAPAIEATGVAMRRFLTSAGRSATPRRERLRSTLAAAEIALALVLLTGAGLMMKSFLRMRAVDPGFRPEHVIALTVDLPDSVYQTAASLKEFDSRALEKLTNLPGVSAAGAITLAPFRPILIRGTFRPEDGRPPGFLVDKPAASSDYFRTMGIRLVQGRSFTNADTMDAPPVAIVSRSVARSLWPAGDALGKRLTLEDDPKRQDWLTIVGVVEDVRQLSLTDKPDPAIYQPYQQVTRPFFLSQVTFTIRTAADPTTLAPATRAALKEVDPSQPVAIAPMTELIAATTAEPRFQARLISIFSVLALLLSAVGIYGVVAYAVSERTREIGIRMALGADRHDIANMVLRRSLLLVGAGVAMGVAGSLAATRVLARLLFEVTPTDPSTFAVVAAILAAVALLAGWLPARRAVRIDPLAALRWE